jgi:phosphoglycolate phosphatase-like HAD superfamily hydrolase
MRTPLQPDEILVIGDTPSDVACAQSIGATSLAVATGGFSIEALEQSGATRVVDSLEGLGLETLLSL